MFPQVRETETTQVAVPRFTPKEAPVEISFRARPIVEIEAPAPEVKEEKGVSLLEKRRRRRTRLANRR